MTAILNSLASAIAGVPAFPTDETPFPAANVAVTSGYITIPIGILLIIIATVFWRGKYLGLVSGYKDYGVAQPEKAGKLIGSLVGGLGAYLLIFPFTVWWFDQAAFVLFLFVVVVFAVAILIGSAHYGKG